MEDRKKYVNSMRDSIRLGGTAVSDRAKKRQIRNARGTFRWLPVFYENDMVHGSWWMVSNLRLFLFISPHRKK